MKTLAAAFLLALTMAPALSAQADAPKSAAKTKRVPKALTGDSPEMTRRIFASADKSIADLSDAVRAARACVADGDYLSKDLAATVARLTPKIGGKIASNQAALVVVKQHRLSRQKNYCAARSKDLMPLFDAATLTLSRTEPQSHPGIKTRKAKIEALRAQANEVYVHLGGKSSGAPKASKTPEPAEGADAAE